MQNAKDRWFFKICFLLVAFASTSQQLCPSPDVPFQGSYFPKKQKFQSDDKITYSCVEGYSLMGNEINNCKSNGDWSNPVPFCDVKANLGSSFYYLDGRGGFVTKASNITDGILSSCSALHTGDAVGTFVAKEGLVYAIRLYLEKGRADLEIWTGTVVCARYRHFIDKSKWVLILCNKNNEVSDRIRIEDISDREKITFLCEFEFYMKDENGCDSPPDRKVSNGYFQVSRTKAELMCDDGYSTEDTGLVCQRNQWTGSNIRCNEDKCRKMWKYMLNQYFMELSKFKCPQTEGDGEEPENNRKFFYFLRELAKSRPSSENLTTGENEHTIPVEIAEIIEDLYGNMGENGSISPKTPAIWNEYPLPIPYSILKIILSKVSPKFEPQIPKSQGEGRQLHGVEDNTTSVLERQKLVLIVQETEKRRSNDPEDADWHFLKSLLPHVKKIPEQSRLAFRAKIQEVVDTYTNKYNEVSR